MPVRIGTAERNSTFLSQGLALKTVLDRVASLAPVEISETAQASMQNAKRLHAGELDFGFMAANWIGRAYHGEAPFTEPIDIRMAAPMNAGPLVLHHPRGFQTSFGRRPSRQAHCRRACAPAAWRSMRR